PDDYDEDLRRPAGALVTLRTKRGDLRGCIGSIRAMEPLYRAVATSAVSAAFRDPRFFPVRKEEMPQLDLEISVMGPIETVSDVNGSCAVPSHYQRSNSEAMKTNTLVDSLSSRSAKMRRRAERHGVIRVLGARALATVALGTALSIGGATEVLQHVHFLVQKDLDAVRVVKDDGRHPQVVAKLSDGFAANSLFKLSRVLPDRVVTQRIALYDDKWLPVETTEVSQPKT